MRVLYFHQHFGTPAGSTGTRSYEFARALRAAGHEVTMVCGSFTLSGVQLPFDTTRNWSRGVIDGIDVIALPLVYSNRVNLARRSWIFLRYALRSAALALREDYDVLFATSTPLTAGIPGIAVRLLRREKPFIFEVRDLWPELPRALGMKNPVLLGTMSLLEWLGYRSATECVGLSPGIVAGINRRAPAKRVTLIPNGCDLELFKPGRRQDLQLNGIGPNDFVAAFTGAHGVANGLNAVLDAAAVLKRRGRNDIKLTFIGDGNVKDALVARARAEQLGNCVFFPPMKKLELARCTGQFDCGLMILANVPAFYYGTSPNKFFDYIAAGLPVVNNYPGWLADIIQANGCGLAVPPNDPVALADALETLARNQSRRQEMGRRARLLAEREFARENLAARFVQTLERVAKQQ